MFGKKNIEMIKTLRLQALNSKRFPRINFTAFRAPFHDRRGAFEDVQ
jgi:hypothetical protein